MSCDDQAVDRQAMNDSSKSGVQDAEENDHDLCQPKDNSRRTKGDHFNRAYLRKVSPKTAEDGPARQGDCTGDILPELRSDHVQPTSRSTNFILHDVPEENAAIIEEPARVGKAGKEDTFVEQPDETITSESLSELRESTISADSNNEERPPESRLPERKFNNVYSDSRPSKTVTLKRNNFSAEFDEIQLRQAIQEVNGSGVFVITAKDLEPYDKKVFNKQAERMKANRNVGRCSEESEVLSMEILAEKYDAVLLKTETEVEYKNSNGSKTDYICELFHRKIAVSVTRAMKANGEFLDEEVMDLLKKKLKKIRESNENSLEKWFKQILHVWTTSSAVAERVKKLVDKGKDYADVVVLITVAPPDAHEMLLGKDRYRNRPRKSRIQKRRFYRSRTK